MLRISGGAKPLWRDRWASKALLFSVRPQVFPPARLLSLSAGTKAALSWFLAAL